MNFDLLITGGEVVTARNSEKLDIGVRDGKIVELAHSLKAPALRKIDANDKLVFPGFIDAHTHMGIPIMDTRSSDDFESGSIAAAFGGVTTIIDFTVHEKDQMLKDSVETRIKKAQGKCYVDYGLHVNITDEPDIRLWEIPELVEEGFTSFKVFSTYREAGMMVNWDQFSLILDKVHQHGGLLMLHAEENDIIEATTRDIISTGNTRAILHAFSRTPDAESSAIFTAAEIAIALEAPLYIVHLSSYAGLEVALEARDLGCELYLETCPQYLILDDEYYNRQNGHFYIATPPLRSRDDQELLWEALADGEIDVVATDHCPFTAAQKNRGDGVFYRTPNGLPGVETLFPLMYTYGVKKGRISLQRLVQLLAKNPAKIFGLYPRKGTIEIGSDADLVIWNPNKEYEITADKLHGSADWSPYEGMRISGKLEYTILRGQILVQGEDFPGKDIRGELQLASKG